MSTDLKTAPAHNTVLSGIAVGGGDAWLWGAWRALYTHVEQRVGEEMRRHGLGLSEFHALEFLATASDERLRMQDLSEMLGLNQSSVTRLVGRLQRAGFAEMAPCPNDGRGVFALLTDAGRTRYQSARPAFLATLSAAFDDAEADGGVPGAAELLLKLRPRG